MQAASTWRQLLERIIEAPQERQRIAEEIGVNPVTLVRWANNKSNPRSDILWPLINALPPSYQQMFFALILEEFPGFFAHLPANTLARFSPVSMRIVEEPLTAQNLSTIISALTELLTKYWLIAKERFADLIEYTQTHNGRFAEEAHIVITRMTLNSPMNMDWKVDLSAPSVAEALVTTIDGITQIRKRLEKMELENQARALEVRQAEQQADREQQMAMLEQEQQRLEIEQRRLEVLEKQLEVQKKGIEYALEIAGKVVDTLHPGADPATRAMEIQVLLPNLVQLQNGKGLELALPTPPKSTE